ncbi:hypothetical protein CPB97_008290 [Podila verticillata]|nr:hypothetical protein CPB97_008290 [Podila verticillata]
MAAASPLDIPEILSLIASFVPAWESVWEGPSYELKFIPGNLLSCTLVCKSWRRAMLPHLWAVYSERHMCRIPTKVLARNSIFFRHYDKTIYPKKDPFFSIRRLESSYKSGFRCRSLKSFTLTSTSYQPQYELLRANPGIVSLQ